MGFINTVLGTPLGYVLYICYQFLNSYGLSILLFSIIVKLLFFPLSISAQKNSIRLLKLQPKLDDIKQRYAGEKDVINEEQYLLFKKEKYNPLKGSVPMLIQLVLILGVLQVMYNPLQHILHLNKADIDVLSVTTQQVSGTTQGPGEQLRVIDAVWQPENDAVFQEALESSSTGIAALEEIKKTDLVFMGLNLGRIPSLKEPSSLLFVPLAAGLSSLALCLIQNALSPGTKHQGKASKWGFTIFLVAFSLYFTLVAPAGVGVYWTASNVLGIVVALILNVMYNPGKLAAVAPPPTKKKLSPAEKKQQKIQKKELSLREKTDAGRFAGTEKTLVFYSISSGQYKYFQTVLDYILKNSDIVIHYLTNDPKDVVFQKANERLIPYYVSQKKTISLMLRLEAKMVVMTVPDIQKYHIKRSVVQKDIEYVYILHGISSYHLTLREGALDYYDTIFCTGPNTVEETRQIEAYYGIPRRNLVKFGASHLDILMEAYEKMPQRNAAKKQILIAPSWQVDNLMDLCLDDVLEPLLGKGYDVVLRPHPEYVNRFPAKMDAIRKRYENREKDGFLLDTDFLNSDTIYQSDILITDWSTIAFEYSFCTKNPCVFINTPIKVMNPNYKKLDIEVMDISLRDIIGKSLDVDGLFEIHDTVSEMLQSKTLYSDKIVTAMNQYIYYPGKTGIAGGKYIIGRLS